ncbi:MAG: hypothetical protein IPM15_18815 [Betaproteobacteria bacterium]|jgi:hypothetical protein|nr:hypothetical protein [Betaproteobacteria bacterium]MCC6250002.1 hypothetical protein [Rubrivivax sp.]MCL4696600.1 hypothetical protein [Burkholderiaceae bacterium]
MKIKSPWTSTLVIAAAVALLGGCGVGNDEDEAGSLTAFNVQPAEITITGAPNACPGPGFATRVFVYGGTAPYQVDTTQPGLVNVSTSQVEHPGGFFDITLGAGCMTNIQVVVTDKWGRQQMVSVNAEQGS